jgi:hypothetical protein
MTRDIILLTSILWVHPMSQSKEMQIKPSTTVPQANILLDGHSNPRLCLGLCTSDFNCNLGCRCGISGSCE